MYLYYYIMDFLQMQEIFFRVCIKHKEKSDQSDFSFIYSFAV
jgi:hypothetical protein